MPANNTQESTAIVTGASAAAPDSQMTARNLSLQPEVETPEEDDQPMSAIREAERGMIRLRNQFLRKGKKNIGVKESLKAIALSSCVLTIFSNGVYD